MNELALFAGVGGGLLASKSLGWRTICAVEKEPYCREVLLRRQRDGLLSMFPIWDDIKTFDGKPWHGVVHIVTAGFPCQPFSYAGKRQNQDDSRNLWPDTIRIIREVRPRLVLLENVTGLLSLSHGYFATILGQLSENGYVSKWTTVSASESGAPHIRKRVWILAHPNGIDLQQQPWRGSVPHGEMAILSSPHGPSQSLAHTPSARLQRQKHQTRQTSRQGWWATEPDVGRVANGVAFRMDRLKAIGNGIVPQQMCRAWEVLTGELNDDDRIS